MFEKMLTRTTKRYDQAEGLGKVIGVHSSKPRPTKRQKHQENVEAESADEYFKRALTIPFLDHLIQEFETRNGALQLKACKAIDLVPKVINTSATSSVDLKYFEDNLPSPNQLEAEIHM